MLSPSHSVLIDAAIGRVADRARRGQLPNEDLGLVCARPFGIVNMNSSALWGPIVVALGELNIPVDRDGSSRRSHLIAVERGDVVVCAIGELHGVGVSLPAGSYGGLNI